jgi:hypothetical protein
MKYSANKGFKEIFFLTEFESFIKIRNAELISDEGYYKSGWAAGWKWKAR